MSTLTSLFLFDYIFGKVKTKSETKTKTKAETKTKTKVKKKYILRTSADLLKTSETNKYNTISYEDLWRSAIRCKLIHDHHMKNHNIIYQLWRFINNIEDTEEIIDITKIDDASVHELRRVSEPVYFDTYKYRKDTASHAYNTTSYLWHTSDTIYITFHADKNIEKDFLKQQNNITYISGCIGVNTFFYQEMLTILRPIINYIENYKNNEHNEHISVSPIKIIIAGYSMGGIIVQIMSAVLSQYLSPQDFYISCHTFGSPKAGNCAFVKWFTNYVKEHYRVVNGHDPITMFPVGCNWSHISDITLQFDRDLHLNILQKETPWYKQIWMKPIILHKIMKQYKHDHDFHIYITRLWKYVRITKYVEISRKMAELA